MRSGCCRRQGVDFLCHFQALCVPCPRFSGFPTLAFLLIFFAFVSVDRILYPVSSVQCHALTTNRHHPYPVQQQYTRKPSVHHQHCNFTTHLHIHYIQNPKMRTTCERRTLISSPLPCDRKKCWVGLWAWRRLLRTATTCIKTAAVCVLVPPASVQSTGHLTV